MGGMRSVVMVRVQHHWRFWINDDIQLCDLASEWFDILWTIRVKLIYGEILIDEEASRTYAVCGRLASCTTRKTLGTCALVAFCDFCHRFEGGSVRSACLEVEYFQIFTPQYGPNLGARSRPAEGFHSLLTGHHHHTCQLLKGHLLTG